MVQNDRHNMRTEKSKGNETMTKEQQIAWLQQIIEYEIGRPAEEMDCDLIKECTAFLGELTCADRPFTDEEIEEKLRNLKGEREQAKPTAQILSAPRSKKGCKPWIKVIAVLAATFTVFFATLSIVAKARGYASMREFVRVNARKIVGMDTGDRISEDGITIIKPTGSETYSSIEELVEKEALHILYPTNLPDGVKLESIIQTHRDENTYRLIFNFSDKSFKMDITNQLYDIEENINEMVLYSMNNIDFYIAQVDENGYYAACQLNGLQYSIQCDGYDTMINLLNNMKGY